MSEVVLHVYDISNGMARQFSPMILGRTIEGIWHTGICAYNKEYYYGDGICSDIPKQTPFGNPLKEIRLGVTEIPLELFEDFLRDISVKYTFETYHVLKHNCNTFTNEVAEFLLGEQIPEDIRNLPDVFLNTQLGQMLSPMIDTFTQGMKNNSNPMFQPTSIPSGFVSQMNQQEESKQFYAAPQQTSNTGAIKEVISIAELQNIIKNEEGVIIDFWNPGCGPCLRIKPTFAKLAQENQHKFIRFCSANTSQVQGANVIFGVQAIPTFQFYFKGNLCGKIVGANEGALVNEIQNLKSKVNSQHHPHEVIIFREFNFSDLSPILYTDLNPKNQASLQKAIKEKIEFIKQQQPQLNLNQLIEWSSSIDHKKINDQIFNQIFQATAQCPGGEKLIFMQLLRVLARNKEISELITDKYWNDIFQCFLKPCLEKEFSSSEKSMNVILLLFRFLCNLFTSQKGSKTVSEIKEIKEIIEIAFETKNGRIYPAIASLLTNIKKMGPIPDISRRKEISLLLATEGTKINKVADFEDEFLTCLGYHIFQLSTNDILDIKQPVLKFVNRTTFSNKENARKKSQELIKMLEV